MKGISGNLFGGLTAAVVALPLALAFGVASGLGPAAGLYGAIFAGFFAAIFGGTPTQITGPTGPMTVVMAGVLTLLLGTHPEAGLTLAFSTVMLGGLFQMLLGYFKLGRFINLVPYTVISGFMTGIGLIIILLQISALIGSEVVVKSPADFFYNFQTIIESFSSSSILLALPLLLLIFAWPVKLNKWLPSPLLILVLGTLSSIFLFDYNDFSRLSEIPQGLPILHWPTFELDVIIDMLKFSIVLGVLGSIDSLLTSLVADSLTRTEHDSNKELIGQGFGNMVAGLFGGLPGAGATMRTVVNIRSGGNGRLSGVVHSITLALLALLGGSLVTTIPHVVLAVILLKVGIDIIDWDFLGRLSHAPLSSISITGSVIILTVFDDLITAVAAGIILASLYTVNRLSHEQLQSVELFQGSKLDSYLTEEDKDFLEHHLSDILVFSLNGPFSFGAARDLSKKLSFSQDFKVLIIDISEVPFIDTTMALTIEEIVASNREFGRFVILISPVEKVNSILKRLRVLDLVGERKVVPNRHQAIRLSKLILEENITSDNLN